MRSPDTIPARRDNRPPPARDGARFDSEQPGATDAEIARNWTRACELMARIGTEVAGRGECADASTLVARVEAARAALDHVVHGLRRAHFACCVLPHLGAPEEIVRALGRLSRAARGALIAIEQDMPLDDYIERGTPLDAALSASLIETLFYPGSTLHDGAVIVRGNRIVAAGVFLPVVTGRRHLGARHRAALALSQLTDAIVLVVSEETGEVSLAVGGILHRGIPIGEAPGPAQDRQAGWRTLLARARARWSRTA